ncbi:MAG: hypothetical protein IPK76_21915 [Lewinellaceae bacterium]|nr:hypothetical protein [Lewinellaceae bacterium]
MRYAKKRKNKKNQKKRRKKRLGRLYQHKGPAVVLAREPAPCIKDTHVSVQDILEWLASGRIVLMKTGNNGRLPEPTGYDENPRALALLRVEKKY